ncbi:MAG: precorrin-6y C5,15-methyltransferase (decarboxylating) subunit CbiE [Ruminococcus callidus]
MRHKLILAGGGSGTAEYLLPAAKKALEEVELVIASPRFLELLHARKTMPMGHISELLESLPAMLERESIGIVVSGDPLLYSLCRTLRNRYPELEMQVIPGVGSLQLLGAAFGLTMEQAKICSIHGRAYHAGTIACTVSEHAETFFFCSRTQGPREIAAALLAYGLSDTEIFVGADLTYPTQKLWHGTPAQAAELDDLGTVRGGGAESGSQAGDQTGIAAGQCISAESFAYDQGGSPCGDTVQAAAETGHGRLGSGGRNRQRFHRMCPHVSVRGGLRGRV